MFLIQSGVHASTDAIISNEERVVGLVNQIRLDPLGYAETLGYNGESLLATLPWLAALLIDSKLCAPSEFLNQRATAQNSDDPLFPEPVPTVDDDYAFTGDFGGVVSFVNFMNPVSAVTIVVNNQLSKELDPLYEGKRYILSTEYDRVGVSFRGGRMLLETGLRNAYFISVCLGSSLLKSEVQIVNMINQMRAKPSESYQYLPFNMSFLPGDFQPLFLNNTLRSMAWAGLSSDVDFPEHASSFGFSGRGMVASSVIEVLPEANPDLFALSMFSSFILNQIKVYPMRNSIFDPAYNEIGSALLHVNGMEYDVTRLAVVFDTSQHPDSTLSRVYGLVYRDGDENGIYTPGEELPDRVVTAYDTSAQVKMGTAVTNNAGQFKLCLPNNVDYVISTGNPENWAGKDLYLTSDRFLDLIVIQNTEE